jgi:hypothetical protein
MWFFTEKWFVSMFRKIPVGSKSRFWKIPSERFHSERFRFDENIFWKIPSKRFHSEIFQLGLKLFSERFLLKDSILKDSLLKYSILKDSGFVEKSDSERFRISALI